MSRLLTCALVCVALVAALQLLSIKPDLDVCVPGGVQVLQTFWGAPPRVKSSAWKRTESCPCGEELIIWAEDDTQFTCLWPRYSFYH